MDAVRNFDMTAGEPDAVSARPIHVTETLVADAALGSVPAGSVATWDAEQAVTAMYSTHYRSLVRLAALLVRDVPTAEEVVQDSFMAMHSAEQGALTLLDRTAVVAALRSLPPRQREALVLRYYGDLSEAQIASAMGISRGAVKSHTARAIASLRAVLEMET